MTAIELAVMTEPDARKLTERIRIAAVNFTEAKDKLLGLVQEAKAGSAHLALGYVSWTAYLSEVLGEEPMRLARGERQEMVQMLSAEGMSTRAIAPIVGASDHTVRQDIKAGARNHAPEPNAESTMYSQSMNMQVVTGMDGKQYTRPEPNVWIEPADPVRPKRRPITDQARDAGLELMNVIDRLTRIAEDDRFNQNRKAMSQHLQGHLTNAIESCQDILNQINN